MLVPPPLLPMLPSASCSMHEARTIALPMVCWVWPMHQTMVLGGSRHRLGHLEHLASYAAGLFDLVGVHLASTPP
jgi:hypothetical protein